MTYTRYTRQYPTSSQWEYKIVRTRNFEFAYRHHLRALLEQEAQAGWVMIDSYNNSQVRFRRPVSARAWDITLPPHVDPYRTMYTPTVTQDNSLPHLLFLAAGVTIAIMVMVILVIVMA